MAFGYRRSRARERRVSNGAMPDDPRATTACDATSDESLASPDATRRTTTPAAPLPVGSLTSRRLLDCSQLVACLDEPLLPGYRLTNVAVDASAREITCTLEVDREAVCLSYMEPGVRTWCSLLALHLREMTEHNQYFDLQVGLLRLHF